MTHRLVLAVLPVSSAAAGLGGPAGVQPPRVLTPDGRGAATNPP